MDDEIIFLDFDDVLTIHDDQLGLYGGLTGFVSEVGARAATDAAQSQMFGQYLHTDIAHMAAAYLFHFAAAQHFTDGNKRTGAVCCDVFLELNGYELACGEMELYDVTMRVANRAMDKDGVAAWIRERIAPILDGGGM